MPKGRKEIVDITTPAVAAAECGDEELEMGAEEAVVRAGYNLRRGLRQEEMERMDPEEDDEADAVHDYPGPGRRGPGGAGRGLRLEPYDGSTSWPEYFVYFEQMIEFQGWGPREAAMVLGLSLRGAARTVLVSLAPHQRADLRQLTGALRQSFCPPEQVHLHQAELKGRKRRRGESMAELGRDIARLVNLAYPQADMATRETLSINAFLDALPGPAIETRLHVIKGRPRTLQEAVAYATEIDAVLQATGMRASDRGQVRKVEEDISLAGVSRDLKNLAEAMKKIEQRLDGQTPRYGGQQPMVRKNQGEFKCFNCGKMGHMRRECPAVTEGGRAARPGNDHARLSPSQ